jgi:hypothetical protein
VGRGQWVCPGKKRAKRRAVKGQGGGHPSAPLSGLPGTFPRPAPPCSPCPRW